MEARDFKSSRSLPIRPVRTAVGNACIVTSWRGLHSVPKTKATATAFRDPCQEVHTALNNLRTFRKRTKKENGCWLSLTMKDSSTLPMEFSPQQARPAIIFALEQ